MKEGTVGDCMYIIYQGECGVYKNELNGKRAKHATTTLKKGAVCGETSLKTTEDSTIENSLRNASIISHMDKTCCLELNKSDYQEIVH
jgi:CRP-like cAMP-binding protein